MKKTICKRIMTGALLPFLWQMGAYSQAHVTADVGADVVSSYIWRGQNLGNVSVQPSLSLGYKGFSLSAWGSVGIMADDTKEFDLTLGYSVKGFSLSLTDYWFDNGAAYFHYGAGNTAHVFEAQVGYDFGVAALNWFTNIGGNDGVNAKGKRAYSSYFSVSVPFTLGGLSWTGEIGAVPWETSFYNVRGDGAEGASGFEVANVSVAASKAIRITSSYELPVFAKAIWNPATEGAYFVFGLSF